MIPGLCTLQKKCVYWMERKLHSVSPSLHIPAIKKSLVSSDLMQNENRKKWGMFSEGDSEEAYISIRPSFHHQEVTCERN